MNFLPVVLVNLPRKSQPMRSIAVNVGMVVLVITSLLFLYLRLNIPWEVKKDDHHLQEEKKAIAKIRERSEELREKFENAREKLAQQLQNSFAKGSEPIPKNKMALVEFLRKIPGVGSVKVVPSKEPAEGILIHLLDLPIQSRDQLANLVQKGSEKEVSQRIIEALYQEHLIQREWLQQEQLIVLRSLLKRADLKEIWMEGLSPANHSHFLGSIKNQKANSMMIKKMQENLDKLPNKSEEDKDRIQKMEKEIKSLANHNRQSMIHLRAGGLLLLGGEIGKVIPLEEDRFVLQTSIPPLQIDPNLTPQQKQERLDLLLQNLQKSTDFAVVLVSGDIDLQPALQRSAKKNWDYIRVVPEHYEEFTTSPPQFEP